MADQLNACEFPVWQMSVDEVKALIETNRQQADELKACKIHDRRGWEYAEELEQERRKQADRIAELEKTMGERLNDLNTRQVEDARTSLVNTPPYAYAVVQGEDGRENVSLQFDHPEMCGQQYKQATPLFTTPQTKPLSDEEIESLEKQCTSLPPKPWKGVPIGQFDYKQFARAIEERHGIK